MTEAQTANASEQLRKALEQDNQKLRSGGLSNMTGNNAIAPGIHSPYKRGDGYDTLPGIQGVRYRQPEEVTKTKGLPDIKGNGENLEVRFIAKCRVFDFTNPQHVTDYEKVMTDCANGVSKMGEHEKMYNEQTGSWKAWMRWYELFLEDPKNEK